MARRRAGGSSALRRRAPWRQLETNYSWDDLVLPSRERDLLQAIVLKARFPERRISAANLDALHWLERAPRVLFVGPTGTGKTMAAQVVAGALRRPIFAVDLSNVLSRNLQEAQAVIDRTFAAAEGSQAILLFKGAELIAPRLPKAAHRERVGAEVARSAPNHQLTSDDPEALAVLDARVSHLLEANRRYDGLVIFAGTATQGAQAWLAGRFDVVVSFTFPDRDARKQIWRRVLPSDARVTENGLDYLATWLRWPGSMIRSCCLAAVSEAEEEGVPLQLHHVARMLERGYPSPVDRAFTMELPPPDLTQPASAPAEPLPGSSHSRTRRFRVLRQVGTRSAVAGALIAAVLGAIVARAITRPAPLRQPFDTARVGVLRISYPSNWRPKSPPQVRGLRLTDDLSLVSGRGWLLVGRTPGHVSALPQSLIAGLVPGADAQVVKVGALSLYRYVNASRPATISQSVYAAPTTVGMIVAVCTRDRAPAGFMSNCERVLGTIRLTSGSFLPLGLTPGYANTVSVVITRLNAARSSVGAELARATTARAEATAEQKLAAAHADAASALIRVHAGSASAANATLVNGLQMGAEAYAALALATAKHDLAGYDAARKSLARASDALNSALAELNQLGVGVT